jgi:hypothetical protein
MERNGKLPEEMGKNGSLQPPNPLPFMYLGEIPHFFFPFTWSLDPPLAPLLLCVIDVCHLIEGGYIFILILNY